jgi:hypothetical protein
MLEITESCAHHKRYKPRATQVSRSLSNDASILTQRGIVICFSCCRQNTNHADDKMYRYSCGVGSAAQLYQQKSAIHAAAAPGERMHASALVLRFAAIDPSGVSQSCLRGEFRCSFVMCVHEDTVQVLPR